jgi:hypothetical protein
MLLPSPARGKLAAVVGWALALAAFAYLMALPPTLNDADESFILYEAKRVLQGQAPYRDFFDFVTPGSFYLYALAYAVGGTSITTARVTTSLLHALSTACTFFLTFYLASTIEAVIAAMLIAVICVPLWNMSSHHWIATAFSLASAVVLLAPRWQQSIRARPAAAGVLAALVLCTHQGRGLWIGGWLGVATALMSAVRGGADRWRRVARELLYAAGGGAVVCALVLGYAVWRSSIAEMTYATHTWVVANYQAFNVGVVNWANYGPYTSNTLPYTYLWLLKSVPALLGLETLWLLWAIQRDGFARHAMRAAMLLLALSAARAIMYYPDTVHIAFILPLALPVFGGMIYRARRALPLADAGAGLVVTRLGLAAMLVIVCAKAWTNFRLAWKESPLVHETAFGTVSMSPLRRDILDDLRAKLQVDDAVPPRLFVHPTDAWIYLTLPADDPTPFCLLRPIYNTPEQFAAAIAAVDRDPAARVVVNALFATPDDPFMQHLKARWHEVTGVGPPVFAGTSLFRLYAPGPR